ncbi:MAG: membrane protein insertase YidC [Gammaproteobacteria bacterium]|nr:membrane protein insertase YidC [Gammaproteobacteria bacterium]
MDIKRNLILVGLAVVSYLMLLAWNEDYPPNAPSASIEESPSAGIADSGAGQVPDLPLSATASETNESDLPDIPVSGEVAAIEAVETPNPTQIITINTPKQIVTVDLKGGDIVGLSLPDFPISMETPDSPFPLLRQDSGMVYVAQSGLIGRDGPDASPQGRPLYRSAQSDYTITSDEQYVDLTFTAQGGIDITKRFVFSVDDYLIGVQYLVDNRSNSSWQGNMFGQIKRDDADDPSQTGGFRVNTYLGAAIYTPDDPYLKYDFEDIDDGVEPLQTSGGWIAFSQHYFLGSWIPNADTNNTYTMRCNNQGQYLLTFVNPPITVAPGQSGSIEAGFWAGPKDQYRLDEISPSLGLTIDYGLFYFIASPIFWLLTQINDLVGNYGLSILLLTLVIKIILYPLSAKSLKSMAKMRRLAPKINDLKDRYGDDKQKFMQAQMELWKKEKVNPFGGCLPMLLQMPVFLGIYWVLNESVELRQASFILWYDDLSQMDPYFILPILMGGAMFVQQMLTPMQTADPAQAKMMKFMPLIFMVFFLWFPAGLVLYYTANSVLSILQQWIITKQVERSYKPKGS